MTMTREKEIAIITRHGNGKCHFSISSEKAFSISDEMEYKKAIKYLVKHGFKQEETR